MNRLILISLLCLACSSKFDANSEEPTGSEIGGDADADTDTDTDADADADTDADADADLTDDDGDGYTEEDGDCDDDDAAVNPGAEEICNEVDDDCDGVVDPDTDHDGDGVLDCDDDCPIRVAAGGTGDGRHADPLGAIQDAIDLALGVSCSEVEVSAGTYAESIDFSGLDLWIYADGEATIAGDGTGPVVTIATGEGPGAVLEGFSITGGGGLEGAGILIDGADPEIVGNTIVGNITDASGVGGGIALRDSSALITENTITENEACFGGPEEYCDGGGIFIRGGAPVIEGNTITDNRAGDGGGIWVARGGMQLSHNIIAGNEAMDVDPVDGGQGGGVDIQIGWSDMAIHNNIFTNNKASTHGGGLVVYEPSTDEDGTEHGYPVITNNVFAFNAVTDTSFGADVCVWLTTTPTVQNNIIAGSGDSSGPAVYLSNPSVPWSYNAVWTTGTAYSGYSVTETLFVGNAEGDPLFEDVSDNGDHTDDDFHLQADSPFIDHGSPSMTDVDGTRADMGAYGGLDGDW